MRRDGFTLLEMSVVLVVIALIVGGAISSQEIIENSRERSLANDIERVKAGVLTFRLKYNCLPGDCNTAINFFGNAGGSGMIFDSTCNQNATNNRGATGTCNGTGNGKISESGSFGNTGNEGDERFLFWQHLSLAGYIDGTYTARGSGISYGHAPGVNVPELEYKDAIPGLYRSDTDAAITQTNFVTSTTLIGKHSLVVGWTNQPTGTWWNSPLPLINGRTAFRIDRKFDDGMPFSGKIVAAFVSYTGAGCVNVPRLQVSTNTYVTEGYWSNRPDREVSNCMPTFEMDF